MLKAGFTKKAVSPFWLMKAIILHNFRHLAGSRAEGAAICRDPLGRT
jgi:hypothetical protein